MSAKWEPINTAPKATGVEILGSVWGPLNGQMVCVKEPFVTFWSPTLNKFFASPTHWTPMPEQPAPPAVS